MRCFKYNVDASLDRARIKVGLRMCIRDEQGSYVIAKYKCLSTMINVDEGETLELLYALRWINELQINNMIFELYSKRVVDNFNSRKRDEYNFGAIIRVI